MNTKQAQQNRGDWFNKKELDSLKEEMEELIEKGILAQRLIEETCVKLYGLHIQMDKTISEYKDYITLKEQV